MALFFWDFAKVQFADLVRTLPRRQRVRMDGFDATDDSASNTIILSNNGPRGLRVSDLATLAPSEENRVVQTYRYSASVSGTSSRWRFASGVTAGADGYTKINTSNGQWQLLDVLEGRPVDPRWFGATGDGVTDDTTAVQTAITFAVANNKALFFPPGTYLCDTLTIPGRLHMYGAGIGCSTILAKYPYSGGAAASGSAAKGVIEVYAAGTVHNVRIEHLTVSGGFSWSYTASVADNHMRHGIYVYPGGGAFSVRIQNVRAVLTSGHGFSFAGGVFQSSLIDCHAESTGGHSFNVYGDNTIKFEECSGENIPSGRAQFRVNNGHPTFLSCNGIYPGSLINAAIHRVSWGIFGDNAGGVVRAKIIGCNIESFTSYGCYFYGQSFADFDNTSIILSQPCVARAIYHGGWNSTVLPQNGANIYVTDGTWGDPETQTTDNIPLSVEGPQYLCKNEAWPSAINAGVTYQMPRLKATSAGFQNWTLVATHFAAEREYALGPSIAFADSPYTLPFSTRELFVNTSGGNVTVNIANLSDGYRVVRITKVTADANTITVVPPSGTINGGATFVFGATGGIQQRTIYGDRYPGGGWVAA